jgi:RAB protein geranylgeranyltransferase component A
MCMEKKVPGSKEDVFKNDEISLIDKRRLMKFLTASMAESAESADTSAGSSAEAASFLEFLDKTGLSESLKRVIVNAIGLFPTRESGAAGSFVS